MAAAAAPVFHQEAVWSPDGRRIAFVSDRDGRMQLYVMRADGSSPVRIGGSEDEEHNPRWSPDAEWITFFVIVDKEDHVVVIRPDGRERRTVARGIDPDWSPAGDRLVYGRDRVLYTASPDGRGARGLVR